MNSFIKKIENEKFKIKKIDFNSGDTICINFKIIDKKHKDKTQIFEGIVLAIHKNGLSTTCTIRSTILGVGVEKTFFLNSPTIEWIKIKKNGIVRKSKIYYIKKKKKKLEHKNN